MTESDRCKRGARRHGADSRQSGQRGTHSGEQASLCPRPPTAERRTRTWRVINTWNGCCFPPFVMTSSHTHTVSLRDLDTAGVLTLGGLAILCAATRRPAAATGLALASGALMYRRLDGRRAAGRSPLTETRAALGERRGIHVREAIRLERPIGEVYRFWRQLEQLPRFMSHLDSVEETADGTRSHWIARGPAGLRVEWDAEIINEQENRTLAWTSLPGSDIVTAGSVTFAPARGGRSTQVTVRLQYAPPAGRAGDWVAWAFGRAPAQTVREDLRRLKQLLEAGELARAGRASTGGAA
jgi:uncharacterized membrane protein